MCTNVTKRQAGAGGMVGSQNLSLLSEGLGNQGANEC